MLAARHPSALPLAGSACRLPNLVWLVVLAACAATPPPRAAALDPANPDAAEAPALVVDSLMGEPAAAPPAPPPTSATPHSHDATSASYTCPMHPEVISPTPGRCPKCGMKLVPKAGGDAGVRP